jgi:hypothetical protein
MIIIRIIVLFLFLLFVESYSTFHISKTNNSINNLNTKQCNETTHTKYEFLPQNVKHSDETLSFSSKEKNKITFGKKQSFFPNETTHIKYEFLPSASLMAGLSPSGLPYTTKQCNETLSFSSKEKDKITFGKKQSFFPNETLFNLYRSLLCFYFSLYALENTLNNLDGFINPFNFTNDNIKDISKWFLAYLVVDIYKMVWNKSVRWDLYTHHILGIIIYSTSFYYNNTCFLHSFGLLAESISIVSGIDSLYIENNELEKSKKCKIYRKNIIKYIRQPLWIYGLLITLYNADELSNFMFYNGIITSITMICLDIYWEKKCDKIINENT